MYKNQLQELAQRCGYNLPSYSCVREGPDHAPRFKVTVNLNSENFESPGFFSTLRQAEHAAAEVALTCLSKKGPSRDVASKILDETGVCKNLLQETAQRAGVCLPAYNTVRQGPGHIPIFVCSVDIAGMQFTGEPAKSKKMAEKSAAMVAWTSLKKYAAKYISASESKGQERSKDVDQNSVARALIDAQTKLNQSLIGSSKSDSFLPMGPQASMRDLNVGHRSFDYGLLSAPQMYSRQSLGHPGQWARSSVMHEEVQFVEGGYGEPAFLSMFHVVPQGVNHEFRQRHTNLMIKPGMAYQPDGLGVPQQRSCLPLPPGLHQQLRPPFQSHPASLRQADPALPLSLRASSGKQAVDGEVGWPRPMQQLGVDSMASSTPSTPSQAHWQDQMSPSPFWSTSCSSLLSGGSGDSSSAHSVNVRNLVPVYASPPPEESHSHGAENVEEVAKLLMNQLKL